MIKKLYDGSFNYNGQTFEFFRQAFTIDQAYFFMTRSLAKQLGVSHSTIKYYFGGFRDNFKVKEVIS